MANAADRNAGNEIEILIPVDVINRATLCAINRDL